MPKNQEKKQIASHKIHLSIKIHHHDWLIYKTHAKIPLSDPEASLTTMHLLSRAHGEDYMETTNCPSRRDRLETFLNDGAIGTIIWKPGFIKHIRSITFY